MQKFSGKLKATYETPLPMQTFRHLLRLFDNKHGLASATNKKIQQNMRESILDDLEERDSLTSASLYFNSEKHKIEPDKLREQMVFKNMLAEKEAVIPVDDAKMDRDHKRHFLVTRVLGHELDMPGSSEWQVSNVSAQQCWFCDRKQFTFFFWSPEFGMHDMKKLDWLTPQDKDKIIKTVFIDRDTNNLRTTRRSTINKAFLTPRRKTKFDQKKNEILEIKSEDESEDISGSDSSYHNNN